MNHLRDKVFNPYPFPPSIHHPAKRWRKREMGYHVPMLNLNLNTKLIIFYQNGGLRPSVPLPYPISHVNSSNNPLQRLKLLRLRPIPFSKPCNRKQIYALSSSASSSTKGSPLEALIFDCDGVILESEDLHRRAYNAAFSHFNVRCPPSSANSVIWDPQFYDELQNQIGGGKPKMRWYFNKNGWPSSTIFENSPADDSGKSKLIDTLQDWKTEKYKEIIRSGTVEPRPGVLRLMDEARAAGIKLAVCSAATKSSVVLSLENLLGLERFGLLDCFLAGDDVHKKKPDPSIYLEAAKRLGVPAKHCLVIEDSFIGLQAALGAGMACVISYTSSTKDQDFKDAKAIYPDLGNVRLTDLEALLQDAVVA